LLNSSIFSFDETTFCFIGFNFDGTTFCSLGLIWMEQHFVSQLSVLMKQHFTFELPNHHLYLVSFLESLQSSTLKKTTISLLIFNSNELDQKDSRKKRKR